MIIDFYGIISQSASNHFFKESGLEFSLISEDCKSIYIESESFKLRIKYIGTTNGFVLQSDGLTVLYLGKLLLKKSAHTFIKESEDLTESLPAVLELYKRHGKDFIHHLKGSFVLLLLDEMNRKCYLFNDRLGLYDLFYRSDHESLYFSTNLLVFNQVFALNLQADPISIYQHFLFDYPLADFTLLECVKTILPGNGVEIANNHIQTFQYSSYLELLISKEKFTWDQTFELITPAFNKAVDASIKGHYKICAGLTSGFDSRTNLSRLLTHNDKDLLSYSWGLPGSIEIKVAREVTDAVKLKYKPIFLTDDFELQYEQFAHQSVLLSNGKGPITRANHAYGYYTLTQHSNFFFTGLIGSELIKPRNCGGYMFTQLFLDLLNQKSNEDRVKMLEAKLNALDFMQEVSLTMYKKHFIDRTLSYFEEFDSIETAHLRLYYFMLKDGFRNYFGHEVHSNRIYGSIVSPYADDDFIRLLLKSPVPDLNISAFRNNFQAKLQGTRLYLPIMEANNPVLLKIKTGRFFKPKDLQSPFLLFYLFKAYINKKTRNNDDTFDSKRWSLKLIKKNIHILNMSNEMFKKNTIEELKHKDLIKLYSVKYFLQYLQLLK